MTPWLLYTLASVDVAFVGYRTTIGRSAVIDKRAYYRRATIRGWLLGHLAIAVSATGVIAFTLAAPSASVRWNELARAGAPMVWVYSGYATVVLAALVPYLSASPDIRSLTSVALFGPLTLVRPYVIVAGAALAIALTPTTAVAVAAATAVIPMLVFEPLLDRARSRSSP